MPDRRRALTEQPLERHVERRVEIITGVPGLRQGHRQVALLGQDVLGAIAASAGIDDHHLTVGRQQVREQRRAVDQERQPRLHPVEELALDQSFPLLASPGCLGDQLPGAGHDGIGGSHLAAPEERDLAAGGGGALVGDGELGESVDLVTPQVDPDRRVGRGGVDVDDRAPHGDLAPVLHLVLTPVAHARELLDQLRLVDLVTDADDHRLGLDGRRRDALEQGADRRHDHPRGGGRVAQPPQHLEPLARRVDAGTDPLEGERLPRGESLDAISAQEGSQVGFEPLGLGSRGHHDEQRPTLGGLGHRRHGHGSGHLGDGEDGIAAAGDGDETGILCHQRQQGPQGVDQGRGAHDVALNRSMAAAKPSARMTSTASAASAMVSSMTACSALPARRST